MVVRSWCDLEPAQWVPVRASATALAQETNLDSRASAGVRLLSAA
jgi:hypothetical protein